MDCHSDTPVLKKYGKNELRDRTAFFGALCLFFSTLEYLFPKPVPFFRLGLANLPVLLAMDVLPFPYLLLLALLKILGQGLLHGTLASYVVLFSICGTFASLFAMYGARRIPGLSFVGISLAGALASNAVQAGLSIVLVFGSNAGLIIPWFFATGMVGGTGIGLFANWFSNYSQWYASLKGGNAHLPVYESSETQPRGIHNRKKRTCKKDLFAKLIPPEQRFLLGLLLIPALVLQTNPAFRALHVLLLGLFCVLSGRRISWLYFAGLVFWITLFQMFTPFGKVIASVGSFHITRGALESGLSKSLLLIGLVFTSLFSVHSGLKLPGRLGGILGRMFLYFEELYQGKGRIRRVTFIADIDRILVLAGSTESADLQKTNERFSRTGNPSVKWFLLVSVLILFYTVFTGGIVWKAG